MPTFHAGDKKLQIRYVIADAPADFYIPGAQPIQPTFIEPAFAHVEICGRFADGQLAIGERLVISRIPDGIWRGFEMRVVCHLRSSRRGEPLSDRRHRASRKRLTLRGIRFRKNQGLSHYINLGEYLSTI
jgi:hypothetical protein